MPFRFSKEIAHHLLRVGAIQFNASGNQSPVYFDSRVINSNVSVRKLVTDSFLEIIKEKYSDVEVIAGIVTGGLPFGTLIADQLNLPFIYVRQKPKGHGLKKQIEGFYASGAKVVVIDDHISTGTSSIAAIDALRSEELNVLGLISIISYDSDVAINAFTQQGVDQYSLCDLDIILESALEEKRITMEERDSVLSFRNSPG